MVQQRFFCTGAAAAAALFKTRAVSGDLMTSVRPACATVIAPGKICIPGAEREPGFSLLAHKKYGGHTHGVTGLRGHSLQKAGNAPKRQQPPDICLAASSPGLAVGVAWQVGLRAMSEIPSISCILY